MPTVAYLATGKLFLKRDGKAPEPIESAFAQEMIEDAIRRREKSEWKTKGQTGGFMSGGALWGAGDEGDPANRRIHISGITQGRRDGELLYALDTDQVGGLFVYDVGERTERRLFHNHRFRARHLSRHPSRPQVAFSTYHEDGTSGIAVMNVENNDLNQLTEGDSLDEAPSWVPGSESRLVFQSAGIGRNQQGAPVGIGPYAVQQLDFRTGDMETLLEDPKQDYLLPRMLEDGSLLFIRRPYQQVVRPHGVRILLDVVLFPVRLIWALLGFLNFFSLMFSGNPLMTAGGPKKEGPTPRQLMLWGKLIDAEKAEKRAKKGEPVSLVPKEWQLVRRLPNGGEEVLAESALSYDVSADGSIVFTNGSAVFQRDAKGGTHQLCEGNLIEHVTVAG